MCVRVRFFPHKLRISNLDNVIERKGTGYFYSYCWLGNSLSQTQMKKKKKGKTRLF